MADFIALTIEDGINGFFEIKSNYPNPIDFPGKNLYCIQGGRYDSIMHEKFKDDPQYQTILDAIDAKGGDVLYLGMGLGLFAKAMTGIVNSQDCVEIHADLATLCGEDFDTVFIADAFTYTPIQNYDTIVIDCILNVGADRAAYLANIVTLEARYDDFLNSGGQVLKYVIPE